jgi:hypothetical protein
VYAIKVNLKKPKKNESPLSIEKNSFLLRDLETFCVHVYSRKEKAQKIVDYMQEQNPNSFVRLSENIPKAALERALQYKQSKLNENKDN